ncbi:hypothetical protein ACLOJK_029413, partial [Asimina triloba]
EMGADGPVDQMLDGLKMHGAEAKTKATLVGTTSCPPDLRCCLLLTGGSTMKDEDDVAARSSCYRSVWSRCSVDRDGFLIRRSTDGGLEGRNLGKMEHRNWGSGSVLTSVYMRSDDRAQPHVGAHAENQ